MNPIQAVLDALAEWLKGIEGIGSVVPGWPEREQDLDLRGGAVVSIVVAGNPEFDWCAPVAIADEPGTDGGRRVTWRLADLALTLQMDLWSDYEARRTQLAALVDQRLHPNLPHFAGLELALEGYHGQVAGIIPTVSRPQDDEIAVQTREWRQRWMLGVTLGIVAQGETPAQAVLALRQTTELGGIALPEPDHTYDFDAE